MSHRAHLPAAQFLVAGLGCLLWGQLPLRATQEQILAWDALMVDAIRTDNSAPTLASRNLAILHTALFDTVNGLERRYQPFLVRQSPETEVDELVVIAAAGHSVVSDLYPPFEARARELYLNQLAGRTPDAVWTNSLAWGEFVAEQLLVARIGDGASTAIPYIPNDRPGQWRRTPPFFRPPVDPNWPFVEPFGVDDIERFMPPGPPDLASPEYAQAYNEVMAWGSIGSKLRTPEQNEIAKFWSDFSYTATPPGHWHQVAATLARARQASTLETARLFALLSIAQADAGIVCWAAKYRYNAWRPVTAIQRGDEDGNPETKPDPGWTSFLVSPSFPEYVSGHSTFSKASSVILTRFLGTDSVQFSVTSDGLPGVVRSFDSLAACAEEIGQSRILGGIHFQFSNRDGKACGKAVAEHAWANWLLPNAELPKVVMEAAPDGLQLRAHGHVGRRCTVESSRDLKQWTSLLSIDAKPGGVTFPLTGNLPTRFYRIREE